MNPETELKITERETLKDLANQILTAHRMKEVPQAQFEVHGRTVKYSVNALFLFGQESRVRYVAVWLMEWRYIHSNQRWFDRFIGVIILANTLILMTADYSYRQWSDSPQHSYIDQLDICFTVFYILEFAIKVLAMGFAFEYHSYLRNGWNCVDFLVVCTSVLSFFITAKFTSFRIVRVLRPLRTLNSFQGMKLLVSTLLNALPALGNVLLFLLFIIALYAILGLQIFMGSLESRCRTTPYPVDDQWLMINQTILCRTDAQCPNGSYCGNPNTYGLKYQDNDDESINYGYTNFDNIFWATFSIFIALTNEGWSQLLQIFEQVQYPAIVYAYFISIIFLGAFFVVNLILAVINESFMHASEEQEKLLQDQEQEIDIPESQQVPSLMLKDQKSTTMIRPIEQAEELNENRSYLEIKIDFIREFVKRQKEIQSEYQILLQKILESVYFSVFITTIILSNTLILALDRHPQHYNEKRVLSYLNSCFTCLFVLEMILKLFAYRLNYVRDYANIFDVLIVALSISDWVIVQSSSQSKGFGAIQAFRAFRLFRLFKLARTWVAFGRLLKAIGKTLYGITNFLVLLFLFMLIASLLGMELFAYKLNFRYNYNTFSNALLSVFVLLTTECWNLTAFSYMHQQDSIVPLFYLVFIVIVGNFILIKLFIAMLITNFTSATEESVHANLDQVLHMAATYKSIKKMIISSPEQPLIELHGTTFMIFDSDSKYRQRVADLISHRNFQSLIIAIIISSSLLQALDDPLSTAEHPWLDLADKLVTVIFIIEALLKIFVYGFIMNGKHSYLRSSANVLDFSVVVFSCMTLFNSSEFGKIKILRVIRVLRPLRLIIQNEELKMAIDALINSFIQIMNISVVCCIFFLLFGIFGVNQFKGSFYSCNISANDKWDCFDNGGSWTNADYNFDNILNAMLVLFTMSTTAGWIVNMSKGIDHRGLDLNPIVNYQPLWSLYYVAFIVFGAFFLVNLFTSVIIAAFADEKDKLTGAHLMTKHELEWINLQLKGYVSKPQVKFIVTKELIPLQKFINNNAFETFVFIIILLNTLILMLQYNRQPIELSTAIQILNWIFLGIFTIESILKLLVYRMHYFDSGWNVFDFTVVMLTLIGVILEQSNILSNVGTATSMLRTFRIFRVLRLVKSAKNLQVMFQTFIVALPGLISIGGLLLIMLFIFAIIFMNLYPFTKQTVGLNPYLNFSSFGNSIYLLFRCATGESWNDVLADLTRTSHPNNVCFEMNNAWDYLKYGMMGCGYWHANVIFVIYMVIVSLVMLNLFVAIIIEGFENSNEAEHSVVTQKDILDFREQWKQWDKKGTYFIKATQFTQFMCFLHQPLGWRKTNLSPRQMRIKLMKLQIPIYHINNTEKYFYYDVLNILSQEQFLQVYGDIKQILNSNSLEVNSLQLDYQLQEVRRQSYKALGQRQSIFDSSHLVAANLIRRGYRSKKQES